MLNTPQTLSPQVQNWVDDVLISTNHPSHIAAIGAEESVMKSKNGDYFTRSRYEKLPLGLVPLNGQPTNGVEVKRLEVSAKVQYYGLFQAVFQNVELHNSDPVLNSLAQLNGLSMKGTEDHLLMEKMRSASGYLNATGGTNGDLSSSISEADVLEAISTLRQNDAVMLMVGEEGRSAYGTAPIFDAFIAKTHTKVIKDLYNLMNFKPKWEYPMGAAGCASSEEGSLYNTRFFLSSASTVIKNGSAQGADVYPIYIHGQEAIGKVQMDNFSAGLRYRPPVYSDPLFQNFTIGWVAALVPYLVNELNIVKLNVTLA